MVSGSMRCPKCGFTQIAGPACKSCHTPAVLHSAPRPLTQDKPKPAPAVAQARTHPVRETSRIPEAGPAAVQKSPDFPPAGTDQVRQLFFHGKGGSLFGIQAVNAFLIVLTLGIYTFWAKVRVRNYLLSQSEFEGDRFAFHGTGKELLIGFLKAALVLGVFFGIIHALPYIPGGIPVKIAVLISVYLGLFCFIPVAVVGARGYRLSRTSWRGIRFSFRGRAGDYIKLFAKGTFLTLVTLGFYYPFFIANKYAFLTSHSYFGNRHFEFDGQGRDLASMYLLAFLLSVPTLGLYWFWFQARKHRYLWDHTLLGTSRFHSSVTGGGLLFLKIGNFLLLAFTLGLGWPWVLVRNLRFYFAYLSIEGPLDLAAIEQEARAASPTGEGLGSLLDLDTGFSAA